MISISWLFEDKVDRLIKQINRADFLPAKLKDRAYDDFPLPISCEQTTSAPSLIRDVIRYLRLRKSHTVLEIGTGSGWQTVLLSRLCKHIYSIEINRSILNFAKRNIKKYKVDNISLSLGNGLKGWPDKAPFDRIVISAALKKVPNVLFNQLSHKGFIIAPIDFIDNQRLVKINKNGSSEKLSFVKFVKIKTE